MKMTITINGRILAAILSCWIIMLAHIGCSSANYGKLKSDSEIARIFEAYQVLPDHKYYFRGTFNSPLAVAGIDQDYELNSRLWTEVNPQSEDFRTLIRNISFQGTGSIVQPWGFIILDKAGNRVGVWYSAIRAARVEINENGQIVDLAPLPAVSIGNQRP